MHPFFLTFLFLGWWKSVEDIRAPKKADPPPTPPPAYELRIENNVLTIRADNIPLTTILGDFVRAGIKVKFDPELNARVSGYEKNLAIDKALEKMLAPYGYVLIWSVVPGPLGDIERLDEVQVFRREGPRQLQEFMPEDSFRVMRGPLPDSPEFIVDEVIIAFKPGTRIDEFRALLSQIGGSVIESLPNLGLYRLRVPANANIPALVDSLAGNPIVSRVEPNYAYRMEPPPVAPVPQSAEQRTGASQAKEGTPSVAVLDSGVLPLSSLAGLIAGAFDAVRPERDVGDTAGHGTQMALIASGAIPPAGTPQDRDGVPVLGIRAFDDNGVTSNFTLMRAIDYAAANGSRVLNMSWGSATPSSFMETAVEKARAEGMLLVAAAGNDPTGKPVYPAAYDGVISVSALDDAGDPWTQSNYGNTVDLAAPGTAMFPVGFEGPPGGYAGTSIASAFVARTLALYLAHHPKATASEAKAALMASLSDVDSRYGRGALDEAALHRLLP